MATRRDSEPEGKSTRRPPARTPEAREQQLVSMAYDAAEKAFRDGTASSQVTVHFLKLGSSRETLEQERLKMENEFTAAKKQVLEEREKIEKLYEDAIKAMRSYSGTQPPLEEEFYED